MVIFNSYVKLPEGIWQSSTMAQAVSFVRSFDRPLRTRSDCPPTASPHPETWRDHRNFSVTKMERKGVFFSWSYHHFWPLEMIVWGYGLFSDRPKWGNVGYFLDWKFWKSKHGQKRQENHQAKTFRKKHRKSQDFALNKDTSLAKICVRKNTFSKYLTWLWNFYTSE